MRKGVAFICNFESAAGDLRGRNLTYENVKRAVVAEGRFSSFEAGRSDVAARIYSRLHRDPELVVEPIGFPWVSVKVRAAGGES